MSTTITTNRGIFYGTLGTATRENFIAFFYRDDNFRHCAENLAWEKIGKDKNDPLANLHDFFVGYRGY